MSGDLFTAFRLPSKVAFYDLSSLACQVSRGVISFDWFILIGNTVNIIILSLRSKPVVCNRNCKATMRVLSYNATKFVKMSTAAVKQQTTLHPSMLSPPEMSHQM